MFSGRVFCVLPRADSTSGAAASSSLSPSAPNVVTRCSNYSSASISTRFYLRLRALKFRLSRSTPLPSNRPFGSYFFSRPLGFQVRCTAEYATQSSLALEGPLGRFCACTTSFFRDPFLVDFLVDDGAATSLPSVAMTRRNNKQREKRCFLAPQLQTLLPRFTHLVPSATLHRSVGNSKLSLQMQLLLPRCVISE